MRVTGVAIESGSTLTPTPFTMLLHEWIDLERRAGRHWGPAKLNLVSQVNRGCWSRWIKGSGRYRSQQQPSAVQWKHLLKIMPDSFSALVGHLAPRQEDNPEIEANCTCRHCTRQFHWPNRHKWYCSNVCQLLAKLKREKGKVCKQEESLTI